MGFLDSIFKVDHIVCPYDMARNDFTSDIKKCKKCDQPFPPIYKNNHKEAPPLFLQLVGHSRAGKTVYMNVMTVLLRSMNRYWFNVKQPSAKTNYACMGLTDETQRFISSAKQFESEGKLPASTQLDLLEAYMLELANLRRWGSRTLVMRDVAGEAFHQLNFRTEYTPYFLQVPVTLMMIPAEHAFSNSGYDSPQAIDSLMTGFISTIIAKQDKKSAIKRTVIITLTKADKLYDGKIAPQDRLYDGLIDYLENDPFDLNKTPNSQYENDYMEKYMKDLYQNADLVQDFFVKKIKDGASLITQASRADIDLKFCITSATGGDPLPQGEYFTSVNPKRVLDPLFMALDLQSKP